MAAENKTLAKRWFEEVWNKGRVEAIDELMAPDAVAHGLSDGGADLSGPEGFKTFHSRFKGAFPDLRIVVEDAVAEGDRVALRFSGFGTHRGDQLGMLPTDRRVTFTGMSFTRWRDGQIVEGWNNVDIAGILAQISGD